MSVATVLPDVAVNSDRPSAVAGIRALDLAAFRTDQRAAAVPLEVVAPLAPLFPEGLRRGTTVAVSASTSLLLALLAGPSAAGAWCVVVNVPALGAVAAAEAGIALDRFALVPAPGTDWIAVASALLDGMDMVAVAAPGRVAPGDAQRLAARARYRGAVLVAFGEWPRADVRLTPGSRRWSGLGSGSGRLTGGRTHIRAEGKGAFGRSRIVHINLPHQAGTVCQVDDPQARGRSLQAVS